MCLPWYNFHFFHCFYNATLVAPYMHQQDTTSCATQKLQSNKKSIIESDPFSRDFFFHNWRWLASIQKTKQKEKKKKKHIRLQYFWERERKKIYYNNILVEKLQKHARITGKNLGADMYELLNKHYQHANFGYYHIYSIYENCNIKFFATPNGWPAGKQAGPVA